MFIDTDPTDFLDDPIPEPSRNCPVCTTSMAITHDHIFKEKEVTRYHKNIIVIERTVYRCPNDCILDDLEMLIEGG